MLHSLPQAADCASLIRNVYPELFTVAIGACFRSRRFDEAAALVEKSRVQPILRTDGAGFVEPAPIASRPTAPAVGGEGEPACLSALAEDQLGPDAAWFGWWSNGDRLVRCRSRQSEADVENGLLDASAMELLAHALPVALPVDLDAADGSEQTAQLVALWRASMGPLVNDPAMSKQLARVIGLRARTAILGQPAVTSMRAMTCDELLWSVSVMLFSDAWRQDLIDAAAGGERLGIVVAPPALLGRVPWAALPLADPASGSVTCLIDVADVLVGLPASLAAGLHRPRSAGCPTGPGLVVADSLGDLPYARQLQPSAMTVLGHAGVAQATRPELLAALERRPGLLVVDGHIRAGSDVEPASAALMLASAIGGPDPMGVAEFAAIGVPELCVVLGCDGAGAATGAEWTGLATGLVWAGAREVVTSTAPVIEDGRAPALDAELIDCIRDQGAVRGLTDWQIRMVERWRHEPSNPAHAPYRWATTVGLRAGRDAGRSSCTPARAAMFS